MFRKLRFLLFSMAKIYQKSEKVKKTLSLFHRVTVSLQTGEKIFRFLFKI